MATLATGTLYLSMDGVNVSAYVSAVTLTVKAEVIDVTGGASVTHAQNAAGISESALAIKLVYDVEDLAAYLYTLRPGRVITVIYGAEGNAVGKPKHAGAFAITQIRHGRSRAKDAVVFEIGGVGAGAPLADMHAGGVF